MADPLAPLDATFLELEQMDEGATMHIGGVMVFDPLPGGAVPSLAAVRTDIASRLTLLPRYCERLSSERTGGLSWPNWQDDPKFDIANHVHHAALPTPGRDEELCEWAGGLLLTSARSHAPAVGDGAGGGARARSLGAGHEDPPLSRGRGRVRRRGPSAARPRAVAAPQQASGEPGSRWQALLAHPPEAVAGLTRTAAGVTAAGVRAALHPREALEKARSVAELIVRDELIGAPHTSLNIPIGATRRFEIVRASLPELKAIGREYGGSVNDVVLAACTAGLRRLLLSRHETPPPSGCARWSP